MNYSNFDPYILTIYLGSIFQKKEDKERKKSQLDKLKNYFLSTHYAQAHHLESAIFLPENNEKKTDLQAKSPSENYRKERGSRNIPSLSAPTIRNFPALKDIWDNPKTSPQKKREINILLSVGGSIALNFGFEAAYALIEKVIAPPDHTTTSNQDFGNILEFGHINHLDSSVALSFLQGNYSDYITQWIGKEPIWGNNHFSAITTALNHLQNTNPALFYHPETLLTFIKDQIQFDANGIIMLGEPEGIHEAWASLFNALNQQQIDLTGNASTGNLEIEIKPLQTLSQLYENLMSVNTPFFSKIFSTWLQQLEIELGAGTLATHVSSTILNRAKPYLTHYLGDALGIQIGKETAEKRKNFKAIAADYKTRSIEKMLFGASLNHSRQSSVFPLSNTWEKDVWDFFIDQRLTQEYRILSCDLADTLESVEGAKKTLSDNLIQLKQKVNKNPTLYPPLQIYAALEKYYQGFIGTIGRNNILSATKKLNTEAQKKIQIKYILKCELQKLNQIQTTVQSRTQIGLNRNVAIKYLAKAKDYLHSYGFSMEAIETDMFIHASGATTIGEFNRACSNYFETHVKNVIEARQKKDNNLKEKVKSNGFAVAGDQLGRLHTLKQKAFKNGVITDIGGAIFGSIPAEIGALVKLTAASDTNITAVRKDAAQWFRILHKPITNVVEKSAKHLLLRPSLWIADKISNKYTHNFGMLFDDFSPKDKLEKQKEYANHPNFIARKKRLQTGGFATHAAFQKWQLSFLKNQTRDYYLVDAAQKKIIQKYVRAAAIEKYQKLWNIDLTQIKKFDQALNTIIDRNINITASHTHHAIAKIKLDEGVLVKETMEEIARKIDIFKEVGTKKTSFEWNKTISVESVWRDTVRLGILTSTLLHPLDLDKMFQEIENNLKNTIKLSKAAYIQEVQNAFITYLKDKETKHRDKHNISISYCSAFEMDQKISQLYEKTDIADKNKYFIFHLLIDQFPKYLYQLDLASSTLTIQQIEEYRTRILEKIVADKINIDYIKEYQLKKYYELIKQEFKKPKSIVSISSSLKTIDESFEKLIQKTPDKAVKFSASRFRARAKYYWTNIRKQAQAVKTEDKERSQNLNDWMSAKHNPTKVERRANIDHFIAENAKKLFTGFVLFASGKSLYDPKEIQAYEQAAALYQQTSVAGLHDSATLIDLQTQLNDLLNQYPISSEFFYRMQSYYAFQLESQGSALLIDGVLNLLGDGVRTLLKLPHTPANYQEYILEQYIETQIALRETKKRERYYYGAELHKVQLENRTAYTAVFPKRILAYLNEKLQKERACTLKELNLNHAVIRKLFEKLYAQINESKKTIANSTFTPQLMQVCMDQIADDFLQHLPQDSTIYKTEKINEKNFKILVKNQKAQLKENYNIHHFSIPAQNINLVRQVKTKAVHRFSFADYGINVEKIAQKIRNKHPELSVVALRLKIDQVIRNEFEKNYQKIKKMASVDTTGLLSSKEIWAIPVEQSLAKRVLRSFVFKTERHLETRALLESGLKTGANFALATSADPSPSAISSAVSGVLQLGINSLKWVASPFTATSKKYKAKENIFSSSYFSTYSGLTLTQEAKRHEYARLLHQKQIFKGATSTPYLWSWQKNNDAPDEVSSYLFRRGNAKKIIGFLEEQLTDYFKTHHIKIKEDKKLRKYIAQVARQTYQEKIGVLFADKKIKQIAVAKAVFDRDLLKSAALAKIQDEAKQDEAKKKNKYISNFLTQKSKIKPIIWKPSLATRHPKLAIVGKIMTKVATLQLGDLLIKAPYVLGRKIIGKTTYVPIEATKSPTFSMFNTVKSVLNFPGKMISKPILWGLSKFNEKISGKKIDQLFDEVIQVEMNYFNLFKDVNIPNFEKLKKEVIAGVIRLKENKLCAMDNPQIVRQKIAEQIKVYIGKYNPNSTYLIDKTLIDFELLLPASEKDNPKFKNIFELMPHRFEGYFKKLMMKDATKYFNFDPLVIEHYRQALLKTIDAHTFNSILIHTLTFPKTLEESKWNIFMDKKPRTIEEAIREVSANEQITKTVSGKLNITTAKTRQLEIVAQQTEWKIKQSI